MVTGEEDETTVAQVRSLISLQQRALELVLTTFIQVRGKLFDFDETKGDKGDWKERGVGLLRLNKEIDEEAARLGERSWTALKLFVTKIGA